MSPHPSNEYTHGTSFSTLFSPSEKKEAELQGFLSLSEQPN